MEQVEDRKSAIEELQKKVDADKNLKVPLTKWLDTLRDECQVYLYGTGYLGKRYDQINYEFCNEDEAKEIITNNLYALLRYKYFTNRTETSEDRIGEIVKAFTTNINTTLTRCSFDKDTNNKQLSTLPNNCCAFRNGVYDFKKGDWLFKYNITKMEGLYNRIYAYDPNYVIMWYMNYDFEPLPINIMETPFEEFISMMKEIDKTVKNYCFELWYNISHDRKDTFDLERGKHFAQFMGFLLLRDFSQYVPFMIGSGGNGKNSIFDGCFSSRVFPMPSNNSMTDIEEDKFVTGSLANHSQNIYLETEARPYTKSQVLKQLTGSMYQTIEAKCQNKYQGIINCKFMFAGNDQDLIKFKDTTRGFLRRINMFEIYYQWDANKDFLKKGDYYDTSFSDDLHEIKDNLVNTTIYIYLGMYGIMLGTNNFTETFRFLSNDWKQKYSDVDFDLKSAIEDITIEDFLRYMKKLGQDKAEKVFYDDDGKSKLYKSKAFGKTHTTANMTYKDMINMFNDEEERERFFNDNNCSIRIDALYNILANDHSESLRTKNAFTVALKKLYPNSKILIADANRQYIVATFSSNTFKII